MMKVTNENNRNVEKRHMEQFPKWFENEVTFIYYENLMALMLYCS